MKRDNIKKYRLAAVGALKAANTGVIYIEGMFKQARTITMYDLEVTEPNVLVASMFAKTPHYWHHTLFTLCRDQNGTEYIITFKPEYKGGQPLLYSTELPDVLNEPHREFNRKNVNPLHIVTTGWITFVYKKTVTEEVIDKIATKYGLWNYSTKWEFESGKNRNN